VAVITGAASGIGFAMARRLARCGMPVALLDVSAAELDAAASALRAEASVLPQQVLAVHCDVARFADCQAAQQRVAGAFPDTPLALLFNNAGIQGRRRGSSSILQGSAESWTEIFDVNVFGAWNIIKAFVPGMIQRGPLPSGKRALVVTTSSVVGLLNHNLGPYSVSKMAVTAMAEQLSLELEGMGQAAAHVSPHVLFPSVAGTSFFQMRGADGVPTAGEGFKSGLVKLGVFTAEAVVDGLVRGLEQGRHYIVLDHELDVPTATQIAKRMEDQMEGRRPRRPEQVGVILAMQDPKAAERRRASLAGVAPARSRL